MRCPVGFAFGEAPFYCHSAALCFDGGVLKSQLVSLHGDFIQLLAVPEVCMLPGEPSEPATHLNGLQTGIPLVAILCPERRELFSYGIMDHVQEG